jgi:tRNA nucleotidyltransferase/poly(A) polymerase
MKGGWVRDKLLKKDGKPDIDIALDNMTGKEFADALNNWSENNGMKAVHVGIISQNPEKSKHLETGWYVIVSLDRLPFE